MHTKLAGHLPLQDMIKQTIDSARSKLAAAEEKKEEKKAPPFAKKDEKKEEAKEKQSSAILDARSAEEMDKLASALDEMADDLIKEADSIENGGESHQGGQQLPTQSPTPGKQPYKRDAAKHQVPTSTGMMATKDNPGASTAVPTDDHRAPGGNGAKYPAKGVLKTAAEKCEKCGKAPCECKKAMEKESFALTHEGHELDAKRYKAIAEANHSAGKAEDEYAKEAPYKTMVMRPGQGALHRVVARHADYAAKKHEQGKNAYNPFGGLGGKSRMEKAEEGKSKKSSVERLQEALEKNAFALTREGHKLDAERYGAISKANHDMGKAEDAYAKEAPLKAALARPALGAQHKLMSRHADYAAKKHEKGQNAYNPFGGMLTHSRHEKAEEGKTKKSSPVDFILDKVAEFHGGGETLDSANSAKGPGTMQPGRSLIQNKDGIKNVTKAQAKAPRKAELAQVLTEPAMTKSTDSKVHENLRNAAKGGVKIAAAAKEYLQKIASDPNDPRHEELKQAIAKRKAEKGGEKTEGKEEDKKS